MGRRCMLPGEPRQPRRGVLKGRNGLATSSTGAPDCGDRPSRPWPGDVGRRRATWASLGRRVYQHYRCQTAEIDPGKLARRGGNVRAVRAPAVSVPHAARDQGRPTMGSIAVPQRVHTDSTSAVHAWTPDRRSGRRRPTSAAKRHSSPHRLGQMRRLERQLGRRRERLPGNGITHRTMGQRQRIGR